MNISPQLRMAFGLVALMVSIAFVADFLGLLPRPEEQIRQSRKVLGESLAVQLSSAADRDRPDLITHTLEEVVRRNDEISFAGLWRADDRQVAGFGERQKDSGGLLGYSSFDHLVIPIYDGGQRWGEVRVEFAPSKDPGLKYLGFPMQLLQYFLFTAAAAGLLFYLFLRKSLQELNPSKVVPQRVNAAFDALAEGVMIIDEQSRIVLINSAFAERLNLEPDSMIGKDPSRFAWDLKGDDVERLPWQICLADHEPVVGMPLRLLVDDEKLKFSVNAAPIEDGQGRIKGVMVTLDDVTALEFKNAELASMLDELTATQQVIQNKNEELQYLATRDPLTSCLNRRSFMDTYQKHFAGAKAAGSPLSVLMVDIDFFKRVNDTHGHAVGDEAIKLLARVLHDSFRGGDAVGRYGGEEFIISLPELDVDKAQIISERLRQRVESESRASDLPFEQLTVSIGVACLDAAIDSPERLIDQADQALYHAKQTGRNRVCMYEPHMTAGSGRRAANAGADNAGSDHSAPMAVDTEVVDKLQSQLARMQTLVETQKEEIAHRSLHDHVTGLPNRFLLLDRLQQAINLSERHNSLTAVLSISLKGYQRAQEVMGIEAADDMLREASQRIEHVVRAVDTIGLALNDQSWSFSRISHNELAMLLVDLPDVESIPKIINRITSALERPYELDGIDLTSKVHTGVSVYPHDGSDPEALIRNATLARGHAVRRSPRTSGNSFFSKDIDELTIKNAKIAAELRTAIEEDGLQVLYQPKVDTASGRVTGVEALARWHHAELGHIGPMEFISVAEHIGVIDQLTNWVLTRVCRDINTGRVGDVRVSVNVSPIEMCDAGTAERLLGIIRSSGAKPSQIEVEITESSVLNNFDLTREILDKLQTQGVQVALDDFGTAYSSLNLLLEIPVDTIKVDRSFVAGIDRDDGNRAVVQAIVSMARAMHKKVVAEGVETAQERDCLADIGCREIQGYLYSRPVAFDELCRFVEQAGIHAEQTASRKTA